MKRIFRIYPSYIAALLIALPAGFLTSFGALVKHVLLLEGTGHFWTLPVEIKFYFALPALVWLLTHLRRRAWRLFVTGGLALVAAVTFPYVAAEENSTDLRWYLSVFLFGVITEEIYTLWERKGRSWLCDATCIAIALGALLSIPYFRYLAFDIPPDRYLQNKYLFFGVAWSAFLICASHSVRVMGFFQANRFLRWIGGISFPLYLVHYIVLAEVAPRITGLLPKAMVVVGLSLVISQIMHRLVEIPMIGVGRRLAKRLTTPAPARRENTPRVLTP